MDKRQSKRKLLGQNFLKDERLVARLVSLSSIDPEDVLYEIGPGLGIITAELARYAKKVIAIERDPALVSRLRLRFSCAPNVEIVAGDFLRYRIRLGTGYKIFASVPFGITAKVMRKLLYEQPSASEMFLVLQKEAAEKYSGRRGETLVSLLAKPSFSFEIIYWLKRTDFMPMPDVESVFLKISSREVLLVERSDGALYREFVRRGFCSWRPNLRLAFKRQFSYKRWKCLSRRLNFPLNARPSELTFEQWLELFREFKANLDGQK